MKNIYKRIIIKLSGEALADKEDGTILDREKLKGVANVIKDVMATGTQIGLVVGAGNIWRGRLASKIGIESSVADYMGMLGTIMNALAVQSALEEIGIRCRVMSAINVPQVCEPYIRRKAMHHMDKGIVTIFAGGTGNPYFTTDSCASLRALECGCDAILMGKNGVDGIYDDDPRVNKNAKIIDEISFRELLERKLGVMDLTAAALLENKGLKIHVFDMGKPENLVRILTGEKVGTVVKD